MRLSKPADVAIAGLGPVKIEPLQHFPIERDLIVDVSPALDRVPER